MVCGLGNVGVKVVRELRAAGVLQVAVERNEHSPFIEPVRREGVPVIVADASRREALQPLRVETARAVMAITSDLANLETGLNARALRPDQRVVMRLFSVELAARIQGAFNITISRSLSALAAPAFVAAIQRRQWLATVPLAERALAIAEVPAPQRTTVAALEARAEARVLAVGEEWDPDPGRSSPRPRRCSFWPPGAVSRPSRVRWLIPRPPRPSTI